MGVIIAQIQKKDSKYSQTVRQAKRRRVLVLQLSIKRKKGGGREASPFYIPNGGSVPSTGQRRLASHGLTPQYSRRDGA